MAPSLPPILDLADAPLAPTELYDLPEDAELSGDPSFLDDLTDRLLTGEDTLHVVDPLERMGRRLWFTAILALIGIGVLGASVLALVSALT